MRVNMQNNPVFSLAKKAYEWLLVFPGDALQNLLLLFFRVNFGYQLMTNGWGKLKNHKDIVEFFASLNIPLPDLNAWIAGGVECFGSALLIVGLASRPAGALVAFTMCVAYMSVEEDRAKVLGFFKDQDSFFHADPFMYLLMGLLCLCFGPGKISLDYLLNRFVFNKEKFVKAETPKA